MKNNIFDDIVSYTDFLTNHFGLNLSLCQIYDKFGNFLHILYPYNKHQTAYCEYIKSSSSAHKNCLKCQGKVLKLCRFGHFSGTCWAGVKEFVFPIKSENDVIGFISITGYRSQKSMPAFQTIAETHRLQPAILNDSYLLLNPEMPDPRFIKTLVSPLCHMLYEANRLAEFQNIAYNNLFKEIVDYLCSHYKNFNLSLDEIAAFCGYSESHIRHTFLKYSGYNVRQYITLLRIKRAKELLSNTAMSIRDIAYETGFNDSNYFTNVFHKETGIPPNTYRQKNRNKSPAPF